jgi:plasmid stabilization system protein ParE
MNRTVRFSEAARQHLDEAIGWYHGEAPHQVGRLIATVEATLRRVAAFPNLGRVGWRELRVVAVRPFPYNLWYVVEGAQIVIVAVTHMRRDAPALLRRLRQEGRLPHGNPTD